MTTTTQSLLSEQSNGKRNKANERWNEQKINQHSTEWKEGTHIDFEVNKREYIEMHDETK